MLFGDSYIINRLKFDRELAFMAETQTNQVKKQPKFAYDYLKLINDEEDVLKQINMLKEYGAKLPLSMLLSLNFNSNIILDLPAGCPPAKIDDTTHPDLLAPLAAHISRLKNCMTTTKIPKFKKEEVFIKVLEMIPPMEVDVLVACKDKKLEEMFPNISRELVRTVFPNYVA
jgi:hypothetical protein